MKNKLNVLLVDDSKRIIDNLRLLIKEQAPEVIVIGDATTLPKAQQLVKELPVDIVVLDIQLPDGNGLDFLKWIKFMRPEILVIMLSNMADECHRAVARLSGAEYFFDKSFEFAEVGVVLAKLNCELKKM